MKGMQAILILTILTLAWGAGNVQQRDTLSRIRIISPGESTIGADLAGVARRARLRLSRSS